MMFYMFIMFILLRLFIRLGAYNLILGLVSRPPSLFVLVSVVQFLFLMDLRGYEILISNFSRFS